MKIVLNNHQLAGSRDLSEPRSIGEILREMAKQDNEPGRVLRQALQCETLNERKEVLYDYS